MSEPIYSIQRMASDDAMFQALVNLGKRLLGLSPVKKAREVELDVLKKHGLGQEFATWKD